MRDHLVVLGPDHGSRRPWINALVFTQVTLILIITLVNVNPYNPHPGHMWGLAGD